MLAAVSALAWTPTPLCALRGPRVRPPPQCIASSSELLPSECPFAVLGVSTQASPDDIRRAFRAQARRLHPDVNSAPDAARQFRRAVVAFEILSDPRRRAVHTRGDAGTTAPAWRAPEWERKDYTEGRKKQTSMVMVVVYILQQWLLWYGLIAVCQSGTGTGGL